MKNKRIVVVVIALLFIVAIGGIVYKNNQSFVGINSKKLDEVVLNNDKKIIYVGRPTCPGCVQLKPILEDELKKNDIKAYYYDTDKAKSKEYDAFQGIKSDFNVESIPLVLVYEDGKEVARFDYDDFKESKDSVSKFIDNTMLK